MDAEQIFLKEGASFFGNRLIYKHKDVGVKTPNSPLVLLPEGEDELKRLSEITDVEAKPARKKVKIEVAAQDADLDELLGN